MKISVGFLCGDVNHILYKQPWNLKVRGFFMTGCCSLCIRAALDRYVDPYGRTSGFRRGVYLDNNGAFVYRLGSRIFIPVGGVRLPYALPSIDVVLTVSTTVSKTASLSSNLSIGAIHI